MKFSFIKRGLLLSVSSLVTLAAFAAETPVRLATKDSWNLAGGYSPAKEGQRTVILLHDLGKNKETFAAFRKALSKEGIGYLALDLRGYGQSTGGGLASNFSREGVDNQFNKMTRDVDAAMEFLQKKGVPAADVCVLGSGLGANVAAKSMTFWPQVGLLALISPTANVRDVLTIPAMRLYKGNVLIAAAAADNKMFLEASVIRNVAYLTTGPEEGKVTFLTAYDKTSHEMLDQYLTPAVIQWLKTPQRPAVGTEDAVVPDAPVQTDGVWIEPSKTEESLTPSVLE